MAYTQYIYDPSELAEITKAKKANLEANLPGVTLLDQAIKIVGNIADKEPLSYRAFGPYWWALKELLIRAGMTEIGESVNNVISSIYRGLIDEETIIAAFQFRDYYYQTFFDTTNTFTLDPEAETEWVLEDSDMEALELVRRIGA